MIVFDVTSCREASWMAGLPPYASAPTPVGGVNALTLRSVVGPSGGPRRSRSITRPFHAVSATGAGLRPTPSHSIGRNPRGGGERSCIG